MRPPCFWFLPRSGAEPPNYDVDIDASIPARSKGLTRDGWLLFLQRFLRLFRTGLIRSSWSFIGRLGLSDRKRYFITLTPSSAICGFHSFFTTRAIGIGRRLMLLVVPFSWRQRQA